VPRLPANHQPHELPRQALLRLWPKVRVLLLKPNFSPCIGRWNSARRTEADPHGERHARSDLAAKIVMEAAIPMSKLDPITVPEGS
jgi:hypothetical protein